MTLTIKNENSAEWVAAAYENEWRTKEKSDIYANTDNFSRAIEKCNRTGESKQATELADMALNSLSLYLKDESLIGKKLIKWITENSFVTGNEPQGALKSFHRFLGAVKKIKFYKHAGLSALDKIDQYAHEKLENFPVKRFGNKDEPFFPKEVQDLIIHYAAQEKPITDYKRISLISGETDTLVQFVKSYHGPLKALGIGTAKQAINYVRDFGKYLTSLDISGIDFSNIFELNELLRYIPNIRTFIGNNIQIGDKEVVVIAESLKNLLALDLGNNQISDKGAVAITLGLKELHTLCLGREKTPKGDKITSKGAKAIGKNLTKLQKLDLSFNAITDAGVKFLINEHLMELILVANYITSNGTEFIALNLPKLIKLNLRKNNVGGKGVKGIVKMVFLEWLDLTNNRIGDKGASAIADALIFLRSLYLGRNNIGPNGTKKISEKHKNLFRLDLHGNSILDEGAKSIAENMKELRSLNICRCKIENEGGAAIAEHLKKLIVLELNSNRIHSKVLFAIADGLPLLQTFGVTYNEIGDRGFKAIIGMENLQMLDLSLSQLGHENEKYVVDLSSSSMVQSMGQNYHIGKEKVKAISVMEKPQIVYLSVGQLREEEIESLRKTLHPDKKVFLYEHRKYKLDV